MEIGSRVAYILNSKARCGVVIDVKGDNLAIKLDDGTTTLNVGHNRVYQIDYWKDVKRECDANKLRQLPDDMTCLEIFRRNKPITFGLAAIRAMWYWSNKNVFDGKLKEPVFAVTSSRKHLGMFYNTYGKRTAKIEISTHNTSFKEMFNVVLHESVHQMNREYEYHKGIYNYKEGAHGAGFLRWIPIVKAKTGITISVLVDRINSETEYKETEIAEEVKTKPYMFAVANLSKDSYFGFVVPDEDTLEILSSRLRALMRMNNIHGRVYAGTSNLTRLRQVFNTVTTGNASTVNWKRVKAFPPAMLELLKTNFKPVEGFYGPDEIK